MDISSDLRHQIVKLVRSVQQMPYLWPSPPDAASARKVGAGSCASKHALLAEELEKLGIGSLPLFVVGPLAPAMLATDPELEPGIHLLEVHECLALLLPWAGPCRVDVTWDPAFVTRGLSGTLNWDGESDMALAIGETGAGWSVERSSLRQAKEALRHRLYSPGEREVRDTVLAALSKRFATWRTNSVQ